MPTVWIPALMRDLTGGRESIQVAAGTLGDIIAALERDFPGIQARLTQGDALRPGLAVVIDTQIVREGLGHVVSENSEIHFVPAIGGGSAACGLALTRATRER